MGSAPYGRPEKNFSQDFDMTKDVFDSSPREDGASAALEESDSHEPEG